MMTVAKGLRVEMIPVKDLLPNPHRRMDRYPFVEEKIERLLQSFQNSRFWDGSIQGRPSPTHKGKVEIAFGHHRLEAARRAKLDEIGVVIEDRSEAEMLRMMADENASEFKHDALLGVETITAVLLAYDKNQIKLDPVSPDTNKTQIHALPGGNAYSLATVARFLGWVKPSDGQATHACRTAFDAYLQRATTEDALLKLDPSERSEVALLTVNQAARTARVLAEKANLSPSKVQQAERTAAKEAVKEIQEQSAFKARGLAVEIGKRAAATVTTPKAKKPPMIEVYIANLIGRCEKFVAYQDILTDARRLIPYLDVMDKADARQLADALDAMVNRSGSSVRLLAKTLRTGNPKQIQKLLEGK